MRMAVLTFHDLSDYPLHEWVDLRHHDLFVFGDKDSQSKAHVECMLSQGVKSVQLYSNYTNNACIESDVLALHKKRSLDRIITFGEDDVIRAARLRQCLGLSGQSLESALAYRDKATMKDYLSRANLAVPQYRRVTCALDLIEFVSAVGLPVFVKPLSSSGSTEARALKSKSELETFLATGFTARLHYAEYASDLIVEKFVEGEVYHVDGFVADRNPFLMVPSKYLSPSLALDPLASLDALSSYTLASDDPLHDRLCDFVRKGLKSLPSPPFFPFHAEVFVCLSGELLLCEVASRTGGARVNSTVKEATSFDLNELSCLAQIDANLCRVKLKDGRLQNHAAGFSLLCPKDVRVCSEPRAPKFDWIREFRSYVSVGHLSTGRQFSGDKIASAVVTGNSPNQVREHLSSFNQWFLDSFTERCQGVSK